MKKFTSLLFAMFFISAFANAQMTITPYGRADFSHFATFPNAETQGAAYYYRKQTQPKLAYTTGIAVNYIFNKKWELKTGLEFQEMGDKIIQTRFFWPGSYPVVDKLKIIQSNQFINIPIQIQYNFMNDKKATPFIAFGTGINCNINNSGSSKGYYQEELVMDIGYNLRDNASFKPQKINFAFNLDVGFKRQLTEKITLNTFLSGNMLLLPTIKSDKYNSHHYNIGLGVGVGYAI